jgi:hypothetical protein
VVGYSGGEAFLWDPVGGLRPLGVQASRVLINNSQLALVTVAPPGRYVVRVRARSASGVGAPSNEVVVNVP